MFGFLFVEKVYDQIIGMVASENLHIFGITVSLAWQLPDKTSYTEKHTEAPMHDTKISISDFDNKTDKIDIDKSSFQQNYHHYDTYYNRENYHAHKISSNIDEYLKNKQRFDRPSLNTQNRFDDWQKYQTNRIKWNYSHDVYPALRMRRNLATYNDTQHDTRLHPEVKYFLKNHRDTRFSLYKSIEKYLTA